MSLIVVTSAFLLLTLCWHPIQADNSTKAQSANASLKTDITITPNDSKRIRKDRQLLQEAYKNYVASFNKYGHGSKKAVAAAKKVMAIQAALHEDIAYHEAREAHRHKASSVTASTDIDSTIEPTADRLPDEGKAVLPNPTELKNDSSAANSGAEDYYNEVVKQFGEDSPQAQAVKNRNTSTP